MRKFMHARSTSHATALAVGLITVTIWLIIPEFASRSMTSLLVFTAIYSIAGLGIAILLGQCGIVSLAQSAFYGIGAYATAYGCTVLGWSELLSLVTGMAISAGIAGVVAIPILRLSGYFLALATLGLAIVGRVIFDEWSWLTGGTLGIGGIPHAFFFGYVLDTPQKFYYFIWPVLAIIIWLHYNLMASRAGFAMRAMRDAPAAAAVAGVRVHQMKVKVFILSAVLGSFVGSLYAHYVSFVSVDSFGIDTAIDFLLVAVLGGARTIVGPILGALFVIIMPDLLSGFGNIHPLLFALGLILVVIFLPQGLGGALLDFGRKVLHRRPTDMSLDEREEKHS